MRKNVFDNEIEVTIERLHSDTYNMLFEAYCGEMEATFSSLIAPSSVDTKKGIGRIMFFEPKEGEDCLYLLELTNFYGFENINQDDVVWGIFRDKKEAMEKGKQKFELLCDLDHIEKNVACTMNVIKLKPFILKIERAIENTLRYQFSFKEEDDEYYYDLIHTESDLWMDENFKENMGYFHKSIMKIFVHDKMVNNPIIVKSENLEMKIEQTRNYKLKNFFIAEHYNDDDPRKSSEEEEELIEMNDENLYEKAHKEEK